MKYRNAALLILACLPMLALIGVALFCGDALAQEKAAAVSADVSAKLDDMRYCVILDSAQNRDKMRDCIADKKCHQSSIFSGKRSRDGVYVLVKWVTPTKGEDGVPPTIGAECVKALSHPEAFDLVRSPEWAEPDK